ARDAGPALAADGGDQRDLVGDHRRRADRRRADGLQLLENDGLRRRDAGLDQHLRRLHRYPAHAADVQEKEVIMSASLSAFLYLIASVCFILALRGLSSPVTSRAGNMYGIAGMVIAIGTTLASPSIVSYPLIIAGVIIGGAIGTFIALRIQMTALPQLVAAFHSLVGLAAVCV